MAIGSNTSSSIITGKVTFAPTTDTSGSTMFRVNRTFKLRFLFDINFLGNTLTSTIVSNFYNQILYVYADYKIGSTNYTNKLVKGGEIAAMNFVDSSLSVTENVNSMKYILVELELGTGNLTTTVTDFTLRSVWFMRPSAQKTDYKYAYYTFGTSTTSINNDLKYFYTPTDLQWQELVEQSGIFYGTIYSKISLTDPNENNANKPIYTGVRFVGFNSLPTKLKSLKYNYGSNDKIITLGSNSYTSIVIRDNTECNDLYVYLNDYSSSLTTNSPGTATSNGWQYKYSITNNNGSNTYYGGFDLADDNNFGTFFANQFKILSNTEGTTYYPNECFTNLYPTDYKKYNVDWYKYRFANPASYSWESDNMTNSAYYAVLLKNAMTPTEAPKKIYFKNNTLIVNSKDVLLGDDTYRSFVYMAAYYLGQLSVSYSNMYYKDGFYDIFYNDTYKLSVTYDLKQTYLSTFASNSVTNSGATDHLQHYTGWDEAYTTQFNELFKSIYNNALLHKVALYGTYLALSDSNYELSKKYNINYDNITRSELPTYANYAYEYKNISLNDVSTSAEGFWGKNTAYKSVFKEFSKAINWSNILNKVRIQTAWRNSDSKKTPYVNGNYSYIGMRLFLDSNEDAENIKIVWDSPQSGGQRTTTNAKYTYGGDSGLTLPVNISTEYLLYYTYYALDSNNKEETPAYSSATIELPNGNLLISNDNYLGKNVANNNTLNKWTFNYSNNNYGDLYTPINNMLVGNYTYSARDYKGVALGNNAEVIITPSTKLTLPSTAYAKVTLKCSFNKLISSKYTKNKINYKLDYYNGITDEYKKYLSQLPLTSDISTESAVSDTIKELTKAELGTTKDICNFNIYNITDSNNKNIDYADIVITIDCIDSDYDFNKFIWGTDTSNTIGASTTDKAKPVKIQKNTSTFSVTFSYSTQKLYTLRISGVNYSTYSDFNSLTTNFNFTDPQNTSADHLFIVNGFDSPIYIQNSDDKPIEIKSKEVSNGLEFIKNQSFNIFTTQYLFKFPLTAANHDSASTHSYINAYSCSASSGKETSLLKHKIYLNQYHNLVGKSNNYAVTGYNNIITIEPDFVENQQKFSYIYIGPETSYLETVDLLNLGSYFNGVSYKIAAYISKGINAYAWELNTLATESIYKIPTIFNKTYVAEALEYFGNNSGLAKYSGSYLNLEFITDADLPAFTLNNNLYNYKNVQSLTDNNKFFGNVKPLQFEDDIKITAYYKPLSAIATSDELNMVTSITYNNFPKYEKYLLDKYNCAYSANTYSSLFTIPLIDDGTFTIDTHNNSDLAFILDNLWISNKSRAFNCSNSYLQTIRMGKLDNAYLGNDLSVLTFVKDNSNSPFYDSNSNADTMFLYNSTYSVSNCIKREIAKLVISYYSYKSFKDTASSWCSWSSDFSSGVKDFNALFNKFAQYEPSYNGVGVGIYMLSSTIEDNKRTSSSYIGANNSKYLLSNKYGNKLGGKYVTLFAGDSKKLSTFTDYGSLVDLNGYIPTSFYIQNDYSIIRSNDNARIYFRFKLNNTYIPGPYDTKYTNEASPKTRIDLDYGISLKDIYIDSQSNPNNTSLDTLYNSINDYEGKNTNSNLTVLGSFEIVNIGIQKEGETNITWSDTPDTGQLANYSINANEGNINYWDGDYIDLGRYISSSWTTSNDGLKSLNINASDSKNILTTINIADLIEVADYKRIPYYISGINIKLADEMFSDTSTGLLYGKSNLYNYLKNTYYSKNPDANKKLSISINITDMYFSESETKPTGDLTLVDDNNGFKIQFYVSASSVAEYDAKDNINNKHTGNSSKLKQLFNMKYGNTDNDIYYNTLTLGFNDINNTKTASENYYLYKFYARDYHEDVSKVYKLYTRLIFNQNLYIKYTITEGNQDPVSYTQVLNIKNSLDYGFMALSQLSITGANTDVSWGMSVDNLPTFTITNDIIAQICPVLEHSIYFKAIKNKTYTLTYILYDNDVNNGVETTLSVDTADQIVDVQKVDGDLYKYLKITSINYNGITVPGYTIRLSDGYKFTDD